MATSRGRRGDDRTCVESWKRVLTDNQELIVTQVQWKETLIHTLINRVLSRDDVVKIMSQRSKNRGYRTLSCLKLKEKQHFLEFLKILNSQGYKDLSQRLQCAYKATQNVEPDIKQDVEDLVRVTCRTTTRADPTQVELQKKFGEMLQAQRLMWQTRTKELEQKLEYLQQDLDDICTKLLEAVSTESGSEAKGTAVERMQSYTASLTDIIDNLHSENAKLRQESNLLREEQNTLHGKVYSLETLKKRQKEELRHTKQKLIETTKALDRLQEEMERRDEEKAVEIAELKLRIQEKDEEIGAIMADHAEQMQEISEQISKMEDDQVILKEDNLSQQERIRVLEAWQYEQYKRNAAIDAKLAEITGQMAVSQMQEQRRTPRSSSSLLPSRSQEQRSVLPQVSTHRNCMTHHRK